MGLGSGGGWDGADPSGGPRWGGPSAGRGGAYEVLEVADQPLPGAVPNQDGFAARGQNVEFAEPVGHREDAGRGLLQPTPPEDADTPLGTPGPIPATTAGTQLSPSRLRQVPAKGNTVSAVSMAQDPNGGWWDPDPRPVDVDVGLHAVVAVMQADQQAGAGAELVGCAQHQRALGGVGHAGLLLHHEGTAGGEGGVSEQLHPIPSSPHAVSPTSAAGR